MNYSPGGYYQPPENGTPQYNNSFNGSGDFHHFGPRIPHFVPLDVWGREKSNIRRLSTFAAVAVLAFILGSAIFVGIFQGILTALSEADRIDSDLFFNIFESAHFTYLFEIIYSVFIVGGPFFLLGVLLKKKGYLSDIPMGKPKNTSFLPIVLLGGFGLCLAGNVITSYIDIIFNAITGIELEMPEMPETPKSFSGIFLFYLSTAVVPALVEEMALRGIIMQPLRRYGDWFAIICSALIFGLMHCNLMQIPFAFLAGVVIGYAVISTESLWTGVLIHFLNNAFTVTVSIIDDFYGLDSVQYSVINVLFYLLIAAGCACAFIYVKKGNVKSFRKSPLVNAGKDFAGFVPQYSARISNGTLFKAYLVTAPMIIAFIAVVYETVMAMLIL